MSEFELDFKIGDSSAICFAEVYGTPRLVLHSSGESVCVVLTQDVFDGLMLYLQEFAATGHFGRHPIQRAFTDPCIEKLAESDPLLASVRQHILHVADDDTATVRALVRLLMAYSETLSETLAQLKSAVPAWSRGLEGTVFELGKEYLGDE